MSSTFYFAIILILSHTQVDVIWNKVSVDEYKSYKTGTFTHTSYSNSQKGFNDLSLAIDTFKHDNHVSECFINSATDNGGYLKELMKAMPLPYTEEDIRAYAISKQKNLTDTTYVEFCHEKLIKNISRK